MKIWITYNQENEDFVISLKEKMQIAYLDVIDYEKVIMFGENIVNSIYQSVLDADIMLAILPAKEIVTTWFYYELGLFTSQIQNNSQKRIIPIILDKNSYIPQFVNQYQYLDLTNKDNLIEQVEKLIEMLKLLNQKDIVLEENKTEYKRKNKQRQVSLYMTLIATILSSFAFFLTFIFASGEFFQFEINKDIVLTVVSAAIAVFVGAFMSIILAHLKRK